MEILYRDAGLVAVDKPSGLVVHRSEQAGDRDNCMRRLRDLLGCWVYPVHRLDRGASGVLLFALDPAVARVAGAAFADRRVRKRYLAVVRGFAPDSFRVDHPLRGAGSPAAAVTRVDALGRVELPFAVGRYATARYSLVRAEPLTGRTHQLRRHLAHAAHPIVGDVNHGDGAHNRFFRDRFGSRRLLLHAAALELPHPVGGRRIEIRAPLPGELAALLAELGWARIAGEAAPPAAAADAAVASAAVDG